MLINFILNNLILFLIVFNISLYLLLRIISKYMHNKTNKMSLEVLQNNPELFLKFLDSYYIKNKYYTFMCVFIYFFYNFFLIVLLRILVLGQITYIMPITFSYSIIFVVLLFLITLLLLKTLLQVILYKEILKLYIFLSPWSFLNPYKFKEIIGVVNLFLYCVSTLKILPTDEDEDYQEFYEYSSIYDNIWIRRSTEFCVFYCKKYSIIRYCFSSFYSIVNFIYYYFFIENYIMFFLYLIFFLVIFYDILNLYIYYTYYYILALYIIQNVLKYFKFIKEKSIFLDHILYEYFYKNSVRYEEQRYFILHDDLYYNKNMEKMSTENKNLKSIIAEKPLMDDLCNFIEYIFYDLRMYIKIQLEGKNIQKKNNIKYLINIIVIFFTIITFHFVYTGLIYYNLPLHDNKLSIIFLLPVILLLFLIYLKKNIFIKQRNEKKIYVKFLFFFWLITVTNIIFILIFFYKTHILEFFSDGALIEIYKMQFYRCYTVEEKQKYFVYLLDQYFIHINYFYFDIEQLKLFREFKELILENINENTKIKDIQEVTLYIIQNCNREIQNLNVLGNDVQNLIYTKSLNEFIMHDLFRNITIIYVFKSFIFNIKQYPIYIFITKIFKYLAKYMTEKYLKI